MPDRNGPGTSAEQGAAANQAAQLLELGAGRFRLQGPLDLGAIPGLARQGQRLLKRLSREPASRSQSLSQPQPVEIQIDLGGVERSSSAAIALLPDWVAQAGRAGIELRFAHWP
ncbi:MAG: STAS domain-containing protein, partial [Halochromatium sp.]